MLGIPCALARPLFSILQRVAPTRQGGLLRPLIHEGSGGNSFKSVFIFWFGLVMWPVLLGQKARLPLPSEAPRPLQW